ncbi:Protein of unknown function (DUF2634) [Popillia japonica]|uniref:DUF2634 domain-containing protein n=1 Tax=Popillia japonica TaxID=7064 RepID=A0AAW1HSN0_POPJA
MIPQVSGTTIDQVEVVQYPSYTYRVIDNQIVGNIDGTEAIQQAIMHIWSTERYDYPIYSDNYGIELRKYKGRSFSYLKDTIQKTLSDAMGQDDRITDVNVTGVEKSGKDGAVIKFTVTCDKGAFNMEVSANGVL